MDWTAIAQTILTVAAGGGLVQGVRVALTAGHKRFSKTGQRTENAATDAVSVQTAEAALIMVTGELKRLGEQRLKERKEWDAERLATTQSLDNASREVLRVTAEIARMKTDNSLMKSQLDQRGDPGPGRHNQPGNYDNWRTGP